MDNQNVLMAEFLICFTDDAIATFNLNENTLLRNKLTNICINFRHYTYAMACKTFFKLFYGDKLERDEILGELFQTITFSLSENIDKTKKEIPNFNEEELRVFTQELLYQYTRCNPEFLTLDEPEEYKKELNDLKEAMANDPILFYRAVKQCELVCHIDHIVNNSVIFLTLSAKTCHMRGLDIMGHNFKHRVLLLPYANKIGRLLEAMHKARNSNSNRISPFMTWLNQHEKDYFVSKSSIELPKVLLFDELTKFSNLVSGLPNSDKLRSCFQKVTSDVISTSEYEVLVTAIIGYFYEKQSFTEAQVSFSLGDYESLANFSRALRDIENAKVLYNNALESFLAFCKS